jgi:hypothetical protein
VAVLEERWRTKRETVERAPLRGSAALAQESAVKTGEVAVPREKLAAAATAWMLLVFGLCYIAIPATFEAVHLRDSQLFLIPQKIQSLGIVWAMVMGFIAIARPQVRLDGRIDPVLSATGGGLLAWGILHNAIPILEPFARMPLDFLAAFVAANVVENLLFGAMLASFVQSRRAAFLLGGLFQLVLMTGATYLFLVS